MADFFRLRSDILYHELDDQILVYDSRNERVHLLDPTTARVLDVLRSGKSLGEVGIGLELVELALHELGKAELLEESEPATVIDRSRRELLRKTAVGAAAMLIPAIITLSPSMAYAQTSCSPKKACCNVDADCCSNKCDPSTATGCTTGPLECH